MKKSEIRFWVCLIFYCALFGCDKAKNSNTSNTQLNEVLDQVSWKQPPVGCVEELVPAIAPKPCPNYTSVQNIFRDWPVGYPEEDIKYWRNRKRGIDYCRASEVLRRENARAGSYSPIQIEISWMRVKAVENSEEKIAAIYESSRYYELPSQILVGAIQQESLFSNLFLSEDGNNFSCGVGQTNLLEWCAWANSLSDSEKANINWPLGRRTCSGLKTTLVRPFYIKGKQQLRNRPSYEMTYHDVKDLTLEETLPDWNEYDESRRREYYYLSLAFLKHCRNPVYGIKAKAYQLRLLYDRHVPLALKQNDNYVSGESFNRSCRDESYSQQYPLHKGWLLAVAAYNAGPRAIDNFAYYNNLSLEQLKNQNVVSNLTPKSLVEAFYWSGKYDFETDKIHHINLQGSEMSWSWFKLCVLHRHIARVMQHVTLPNKSLNVNEFGSCRRSTYNPATGKLIESGVPFERRLSSGRKI